MNSQWSLGLGESGSCNPQQDPTTYMIQTSNSMDQSAHAAIDLTSMNILFKDFELFSLDRWQDLDFLNQDYPPPTQAIPPNQEDFAPYLKPETIAGETNSNDSQSLNQQSPSKEKATPPFLCNRPNCKRRGIPFKNKSTWKRHVDTQHLSPSIECQWCEKKFRRSDNLKQHLRAIHWDIPEVRYYW